MKRPINLIAMLLVAGCAATAPPATQPVPQTVARTAPAPAPVPAPAVTPVPLTAPPPELHVVTDLATYRQQVAADPDKELIDVSTLGIRTEIRYATDNNFMKRPLYPVAKAFLRKPVALALKEVQDDLEAIGFTIKVYDGYRPWTITNEMWNQIHDPDYVADPSKGSRHNRGAAVDLTMTYLAPGWILRMPSNYDEFSERAHHSYTRGTEKSRQNRDTLKAVMMRHGFEPFETEWWHYDFTGWQKFELMDIPLEELGK
jgi:D-alanyl-D-alanine dipeptidase